LGEVIFMRLPLNVAFLEWAIRSLGEEEFVQALDMEYQAKRKGGGQAALSLDLARKPNSLRGLWDRAVTVNSGRIARTPTGAIDFAPLVRFLTAMQPFMEICARPQPWQRWHDGDEVLAVLGERDVHIDEVSQKVKQRAVGARDVQTIALLAETCYARLQLDCRLTTHHVPAKLSADRSVAKLEELRSRRNLGMIVVIGSPVSNPLV
jgi:hypothetical protein